MSAFNYRNFHFFDKNGEEIILNYTAGVQITVYNPLHKDCDAIFSLVTTSNNILDSDIFLINGGKRFPEQGRFPSYKIQVSLPNGRIIDSEISSTSLEFSQYASSEGTEYSISIPFSNQSDDIKTSILEKLGISQSDVTFPSTTFTANLTFDRVSTGLVETQSIYALVESKDNIPGTNSHGMTDLYTYSLGDDGAKEFIDKYNLFFFIDCRKQKDFRFFGIDADEIVWSDRHSINFEYGTANGSDNGFRVDIGFKGEDEGVYEDTVYVCLLDKSTQDITIIGTFKLFAETEGFDERYRTFFTNFGLPQIEEYENVFRDSSSSEDNPDYISMNKHAKTMFLAYDQIFPYVGTYKALFNAIDILGYDDIFFKEWYKRIGDNYSDDKGYVAFDISYKSKNKENTINAKPIEERIHLKKLNWLSMMYRLNRETDDPIDKWGFPTTVRNETYYDANELVKLVSLKDWLEKYVMGINCRMVDIGGEGIVFERYNLAKFGSYQQVFDYTNEKKIGISANTSVATILDGSANIYFDIHTTSEVDEVSEYSNIRFEDMCIAYFDESGKYIDTFDNLEDNSKLIYFGKTFDLHNNMDTFFMRSIGELDSFKFRRNDFLDELSPDLIIDEGKIFFDPLDLVSYKRNSAFTNLPVIQIKKGRLKRYYENDECFGKLAFDASVNIAQNGEHYIDINVRDYYNDKTETHELNDILTLIPPTYSVSSNMVTFYPRFSDEFERTNTIDIKPNTVSDATTVPYDRRSYGLRYCSETNDGTPAFFICGYENPELELNDGNDHFPYDVKSEYQIDILEGSMIFNDPDHNRKISLNFSYDGFNRKVGVTVLEDSEHFNLMSYEKESGIETPRFTNGIQYPYFCSNYRNNPESVIKENTTHPIKVINAGRYSVTATVLDEFNNMFCVGSPDVINVLLPDIDASVYSSISEGSTMKSAEQTLIYEQNNSEGGRCVYEFTPKKKIVSHDGLSFVIDYYDSPDGYDFSSELVRNDNTFKRVQITNTSDRFELIASYTSKTYPNMTVLSVLRKSYRQSFGNIMADSFSDLEKCATYEGISPDNEYWDIDEYLYKMHKISSGEEGTTLGEEGSILDANIILYDEVSETPLCMYPGIIASCRLFNDLPSNGLTDEYRIVFDYVSGDKGSVTAQDINEFIELAKKPFVSIYATPSWKMRTDLIDGNNSIFMTKGYGAKIYPFDKPFQNYGSYKIIFGNGSLHHKLRNEYDNYYGETNINTLSNEVPVVFYDEVGYTSDDIRQDDSSIFVDDVSTNASGKLGLSNLVAIKSNVTPEFPTEGTSDSYGQFAIKILESENNLYRADTPVNNAYSSENKTDAIMFTSQSSNELSEFYSKLDPSSNYKNGAISITDSKFNRNISYHIDTTYTMSLRNFDVRNGNDMWLEPTKSQLSSMKTTDEPIEIKYTGTTIPLIVSPSVKSMFPKSLKTNEDILSSDNFLTIKWSVYKQNTDERRELILECFNKFLTVSLNERGVYDLEMTVYDFEGNRFNKKITGFISIL